MKKKKGFTLIEVLVTIVIISLLSGVGIVAYQSFFKTGEQRHFEATESDVLLAGNDYFTDHRDELPTGNNIGEVSLNDLINAKYIEEVTDSKGNKCDSENNRVFVYRENNKYVYEVCIECGGYKSEGKYCDGALANAITITAKTKNTNRTYNALATYNAAEYTNNENVLVTFSMINNKATKFEAINTKTNDKKSCSIESGNSCYVDIDSSGTYKVTAFDENNKIVAENQYFNVKIAKNGPKFSIANAPSKYQITQAECSSNKTKKKVTYTIVKDNINEEYKTIQYRLNNGSYKTINGLTIEEELESGHYNLEVKITNFAGEPTVHNKEFDISYFINYEYEDDHTTGTHEVVKGQKYDYLSALPTHKVSYGNNNLEIRWHPDNTSYSDAVRITGNTVVGANCTYKILGLMAIPVEEPSNWTAYCDNITYNGSKQTLTTSAPTNVAFVNNEGTNAGEYTVKAHINSPLYIWSSDWTFADKEFKCNIKRRATTCTAASDSKTYDCTSLSKTSGGSCTNIVSGQTTSLTNTGTITDYGEVTNTLSSVKIYSGSTEVTSNYTITKVNGKLTINKRSTTCTAASDSKVYDGTALTKGGGSCTNLVCSHSPSFSNSGSITNVGTTDNNVSSVTIYSGSNNVTGNYSISTAKGTLTITAKPIGSCPSSPSNKTYTGSSISSGVTCPTGSSASGDTSATNVGTYTVTCTGSGNYTGSCSTTWKIIAKSIGSCPSSPSDKTYTGSSISSGITCPTGATASGTQSATNVGTYTVTCTGSGNYTGSCSTNWKIVTKSIGSCPSSPANKTYTGSSISSGITCPTGTTASGDTSATNVGTYTVTCTGSGNYTGSCSTTWKIVAASMSGRCSGSPADKVFSGSSQNSGISCPGGSSASGDTSATNVGTYYVTCTGSGNYTGSCSTSWKITKKALTITPNNQTINYGTSIATGVGQVTASGLVSGDSLTSITLTPTTSNVPGGRINSSNATTSKGIGNYSVTYQSGNLTINKVAAGIICKNPTYNGQSQDIVLAYSGCTPSNNIQTNAGTYWVTCTADSNHTEDLSVTCEIGKAQSYIVCKNPLYYGGQIALSNLAYGVGCTVKEAGNHSVGSQIGPYRMSGKAINSNYLDPWDVRCRIVGGDCNCNYNNGEIYITDNNTSTGTILETNCYGGKVNLDGSTCINSGYYWRNHQCYTTRHAANDACG